MPAWPNGAGITRDAAMARANSSTDGDVSRMPEIGIEFPLAEFYQGSDLLDGTGEGREIVT